MRKANTPALPFATTLRLPLFSLLVSLVLAASPAQAQCIGTGVMNGNNFGRTGSGAGFSAVNNIASTDNNYATAEVTINLLGGVLGAITGEGNTQYLTATGFNFTIPANAVICGVTVHIRKRAGGVVDVSTRIKDESVRLIKGGTITGDNKATTSEWPTDFVTESYAGSPSEWQTDLTPADVNNPNFGVAFSGKVSSLVSAFPRLEIDHISMVVEYQPVTTLPLTVKEFSTRLQKATATCEWTIAEEEAGAQITLQQSTDNRTWKDIQQYGISIQARESHYKQVTRLAAKGTYFYRLKLVNREGKTTYSKTNSVQYTTNGEVKVYPTVAKSMLYVENVEPSDKIQVYNFSNQLVQTSTVAVKEGLIAVRISELPKGMYLLKVGKTTKRFIKE